MGILFWYILRQYVKVFSLCMTGVLTVYLVVDFFEKLRKFLKYDADLGVILTYFLYRIPDIAFQLAPLAALMATILTFGFLNRNHEITAMRSCGMSFWQIAMPFLAFGVVASSFLFSFTAVVIPLANHQAEFIKTVLISKKPQALTLRSDGLWLRLREDALLRIDAVGNEGRELEAIALYRLDSGFRLQEILKAEKATFSSDGWRLYGVRRRHIDSDGAAQVTTHEELFFGLPLTPDDFRTWLAIDPDNMTLRQLRAYIERLERNGHNGDRFATDYWGRIAFSTVTLVMTIIGLGISASRTGVRGMTAAKGIGQALGVGFLFWATHSLGMVLGRNGALFPLLSGWFAVMMFSSIGLNLFLKTR